MPSDVVVYLRGGTYTVTSTLTFGTADSGQNGHYVKYLAYPGERPIVTGGQPIKDVRDLLRRMESYEWSAAEIADIRTRSSEEK